MGGGNDNIIGGGRGGGGGGGDGSSGDDSEKQPGNSGIGWKGWEDRVKADPEFAFKVLLEQVIGVGASVVGDMSSRPNWGLNELDFVFSTLVVGSILNFSLMYLLAPTASAAANPATMSLIQRILSESTLKGWGAPGGNMFEPGAYSVGARGLNFLYKGGVFAVIGLMAGIIGTATSNGLLLMRKKLDPDFKLQNEPPNILYNACTWSLHMGISSNLRYQILGGTDRVLVNVMPQALFRTYSALIRGFNNIVGGMSFVTLARYLGVQKATTPVALAPPPPPPPPPEEKKRRRRWYLLYLA